MCYQVAFEYQNIAHFSTFGVFAYFQEQNLTLEMFWSLQI